MEPVGLVVGIASLVSTCLDVVDRVEIFNNFGTQSRQLNARFEACKLRLREWAHGVGIVDGVLNSTHHARLDIPEIVLVVQTILQSVCEIFEKAEKVQKSLRLSIDKDVALPIRLPGAKKIGIAKVVRSSKRDGIGWAMKGKVQFTEQVEVLESLIGRLYDTVPPTKDEILVNQHELTQEIENIQLALRQFREELTFATIRQSRRAIDDWLGVVDIDRNYERHIQDRLDGTCDWVLRDSAYQDWRYSSNAEAAARFLWIHGPPGHGKSIICARLFQNMMDEASFPCTYLSATSHVQAGGQPEEVIRYWLSHLTKINDVVFDLVRESMQSAQSTQKAPTSEVWAVFKSVVRNVDNCTCVLDGLDEYNQGKKGFLQKLKLTVSSTRARCLIVSRGESDVEEELGKDSGEQGKYVMFECKVSKASLQGDIKRYSDYIVKLQLPKKEEAFRHQLATELADRCEGMFLWIKLQQDQLRPGQSSKRLRDIVKSSPQGLFYSYERNWARIEALKEHDRNRAIHILRWTIFSREPLTVGQLTEALIIDPEDNEDRFPVDDLPDDVDDEYINGEIKSLCCSMIDVQTIDADTPPNARTVHVIHPSVKEYLLSVLPIPSTMISTLSMSISSRQHLHHNYLARVCLRYLNSNNVWNLEQKFDSFVEYASFAWFEHCNLAGDTIELLDRAVGRFFAPGNENFLSWAEHYQDVQLERPTTDTTYMSYASRFGLVRTMKHIYDRNEGNIDILNGNYGSSLRLACAFTRQTAIKLLIEWGVDLNLTTSDSGTALYVAALRGHGSVVKYLIDNGADLTIVDGTGESVLHAACRNGNLQTVLMLLELGANPNARENKGRTPLSCAATYGHLEVVKTLLETESDISRRDENEWTYLHYAATNGHSHVTRLLLDHGVDVTAKEIHGHTSLEFAAIKGHLEVAKLLLSHKDDVSWERLTKGRALYLAADKGYADMAQLLLDHDADFLWADKGGWTPLHQGVLKGHIQVVKILLDCGADVSVTNKEDITPLQAAAWHGHIEIVKLLLDMGANISERDTFGHTSLHHSAYNGHVAISRLLLDHGADINSRGNSGSKALHHAVRYSKHLETTRFLLSQDPDGLEDRDYEGSTTLYFAAKGGCLEIAMFLLEQGAKMPVQNNQRRQPLHAAAYYGHSKMVRLLLDHHADISAETEVGLTSLHFAAVNGHTEVVRILLSHGADISAQDVSGTSSLHRAANEGNLEVLKLLLSNNASVNDKDKMSRTALHIAATRGRHECIEVLIENGADLSAVDLYGRSCLEWLTVLDSKKWHMDEISAMGRDEKKTHLIRTVREFSQHLLKETTEPPTMIAYRFNMLGRCFLYLNCLEDASFAFGNTVLDVSSTGSASHQISCDLCGISPIVGARYICETCFYTNLCSVCVSEVLKDERHPVCRGHTFFEMSAPHSGCLPTRDTEVKKLEHWSRFMLDATNEHDELPSAIQER